MKNLTPEERARVRALLKGLRDDFRELRVLFERLQARTDDRPA